jgi:NADPH-dependent 7-cyano-7-deazaguanine reductase QueF
MPDRTLPEAAPQLGVFTSLCPVTGQPDFAFLIIYYVPIYWGRP